MTKYKIKNRRGWIRIVEAFVAMLLITGIVFVIIGNEQNKREDTDSEAYTSMVSILREIELDGNLRSEIINTEDSSLPVEWANFSVSAPQTRTRIMEKTPGYLKCVGKICAANDVCLLAQDEQNQEKTIYAESVVISSTIQTYNPRLLKLFCWTK